MVTIKQEIYEAMIRAFEDHEPECGGILGAVPGGPITHFYFDKTGMATPRSYTPRNAAGIRMGLLPHYVYPGEDNPQ